MFLSGFTIGVSLLSYLKLYIMAKQRKNEHVNPEIKYVTESVLKEALDNLNQKNREIRESFRMDRETFAFRAGK